jgi:hypothetical protein
MDVCLLNGPSTQEVWMQFNVLPRTNACNEQTPEPDQTFLLCSGKLQPPIKIPNMKSFPDHATLPLLMQPTTRRSCNIEQAYCLHACVHVTNIRHIHAKTIQ